jgi:hypothetical protein
MSQWYHKPYQGTSQNPPITTNTSNAALDRGVVSPQEKGNE